MKEIDQRLQEGNDGASTHRYGRFVVSRSQTQSAEKDSTYIHITPSGVSWLKISTLFTLLYFKGRGGSEEAF